MRLGTDLPMHPLLPCQHQVFFHMLAPTNGRCPEQLLPALLPLCHPLPTRLCLHLLRIPYPPMATSSGVGCRPSTVTRDSQPLQPCLVWDGGSSVDAPAAWDRGLM